jgi:cytochrome P450
LFDSTLLLMTGEDHRRRRRLEMQLFARSAIKLLNEQTLLPGIRLRLEQLFDGAAPPLRVDLVPLLKTMMYRVAATVTGINLLGDAESVHSFIELQERFALGGSVTYESADTGRAAFIPAGYLVRMDVIAAIRDPDAYGPDPGLFDPYRTTSLDKRVRGMAFGDGPHKCIGEGMAGSPAGAGTRSDGIIPSVVQVLFELGIQPDRPPRTGDR